MTHSLRDLMKAQHPLICLQTAEEARAIARIEMTAIELEAPLIQWSITTGAIATADSGLKSKGDLNKPADACLWLMKSQAKIVVLRDFAAFLKDPVVLRALRDLVQEAYEEDRTVILLGVDFEGLPPEIAKTAAIIDLALPDRTSIAAMISDRGGRAADEVIDALTGLTEVEIHNALSICSVKTLGSLDAKILAAEKRQIIRKNGLLEFIDTDATIESIGGLGRVKTWLKSRARARGAKAKAYGLKKPKGLLLTGVAGTGKSLTAKAAASIFGVPLIRLDIGRCFAGLVGSSEANIRSVIRTIDAIGPCVLWIDEIEKGFGGGGGGDGNTSSRVLGSFLSWMNDRTSDCFVIATANRVRALPAELIRKGRFDEIFFVGLPTPEERREILKVHLARMPCAAHLLKSAPSFDSVINVTDGFSGGEIEQIVSDAAFAAFDLEQEHVSIKDLLVAGKSTKPLSSTSSDQVEELIAWAKDHAVNASDSVAR